MSDNLEPQPGVEPAVAAEPPQQDSTPAEPAPAGEDRVEAAFAKRLAAERSKIEQEYADKFKDFDTYRGITEYFRELNDFTDVSELNERIEMERLQARAEQSQVSPEVQRRLEELEAKASEADTLREQQNLQNWYSNFRSELDKFATERKVDADAIEKFIVDHQLQTADMATNMDIAYKAMTWTDVQTNLAQIKKDAIAEYLQSKGAPNVIGAGGGPAHVPASTPKTWDQARAGALEMIRSANRNI